MYSRWARRFREATSKVTSRVPVEAIAQIASAHGLGVAPVRRSELVAKDARRPRVVELRDLDHVDRVEVGAGELGDDESCHGATDGPRTWKFATASASRRYHGCTS